MKLEEAMAKGKKQDRPNVDETNPITSCTITWDNLGLSSTDILHVTTRILPKEIQVRFYNGYGLVGGKIWPVSDQQKTELFDLLDQCRRECDKEDYSVKVCDGHHWELKVCTKGKCLRAMEGTLELPPKGQKIRDIIVKIVGDENCYF